MSSISLTPFFFAYVLASTLAPRAGRFSANGRKGGVLVVDFNPRPVCGALLHFPARRIDYNTHFNPRPVCGALPCQYRRDTRSVGTSILAPCAGRFVKTSRTAGYLETSILAPCAGRFVKLDVGEKYTRKLQSSPHVRGASIIDHADTHQIVTSILAPCAGRFVDNGRITKADWVTSILAPCAGRFVKTAQIVMQSSRMLCTTCIGLHMKPPPFKAELSY